VENTTIMLLVGYGIGIVTGVLIAELYQLIKENNSS